MKYHYRITVEAEPNDDNPNFSKDVHARMLLDQTLRDAITPVLEFKMAYLAKGGNSADPFMFALDWNIAEREAMIESIVPLEEVKE